MRRKSAITHIAAVVVLAASTLLTQATAASADTPLPPTPVSVPQTADTPGNVTVSERSPDQSQSGATCQDYEFPVTVAPGTTQTHQVWGQLCSKTSFEDRTIQVLLHGGTYNHYYWDWPYQPANYSYVSAATTAGFVTLNIDRLGYGLSDHPFDVPVTFESNAWVAHQIISYVRAGALGTDFGKVALVGHSMGGFTTFTAAGRYPADADAVIVTGATHVMNMPTIAAVTATFYPAALDPKFANADFAPISAYTTTLPGTRCGTFYNVPNVDPQICALDEVLKDTVTAGEWATLAVYPASPTPSTDITAPVLNVLGNLDSFMCVTPTCDSDLSNAPLEELYYPNAASYELYLQPNSGHMNNLHYSASQWFDKSSDWLTQTVGVVSP